MSVRCRAEPGLQAVKPIGLPRAGRTDAGCVLVIGHGLGGCPPGEGVRVIGRKSAAEMVPPPRAFFPWRREPTADSSVYEGDRPPEERKTEASPPLPTLRRRCSCGDAEEYFCWCCRDRRRKPGTPGDDSQRNSKGAKDRRGVSAVPAAAANRPPSRGGLPGGAQRANTRRRRIAAPPAGSCWEWCVSGSRYVSPLTGPRGLRRRRGGSARCLFRSACGSRTPAPRRARA